jgi:hypothetical protein
VINNDTKTDEKKEVKTTEKPNESTGFYVRGFVRILDPETKTVILETNN